jgi:hypothetical protein
MVFSGRFHAAANEKQAAFVPAACRIDHLFYQPGFFNQLALVIRRICD